VAVTFDLAGHAAEAQDALGRPWCAVKNLMRFPPPTLYKYRPVTNYALDALHANQCWFATREMLNDPYDCSVRLPKAVTVGEARQLRSIVADRSYAPTGTSRTELLDAIETSTDPFQRLGFMAEYAGDHELLEQLRAPAGRAHDVLLLASLLALREFFDAITVFCASESPDNKVMWGNYADRYKGFCIGYRVVPTHPLARRLKPVNYTADARPVNLAVSLLDPVVLRDSLVYNKPLEWQYEREWRVTFPGEAALREGPLEMTEIIFGAAMQPHEREIVAAAATTRAAPRFRQIRLAYKSGYDLEITDC
jgi:hypothetical protein